MDLTFIRQFIEQCQSIIAIDPDRTKEVLADLEVAKSAIADLEVKILLDEFMEVSVMTDKEYVEYLENQVAKLQDDIEWYKDIIIDLANAKYDLEIELEELSRRGVQ